MAAVESVVAPAGLTEKILPQDSGDDPFVSSRPDARRASHRYSAFDTQLFATYQPVASPTAAKRALESHLTETDRRLEEASKLGTALVKQRQEIAQRLKEVQDRQEEEIGPELRQKIVEVEKEYHELGRESARAFLSHKARSTNVEEGHALGLASEFAVIGAFYTSPLTCTKNASRILRALPNTRPKLLIRRQRFRYLPVDNATSQAIRSMISSSLRRLAPLYFPRYASCRVCWLRGMTP